ncbi:MAG: hypothetical protein ACOYMG_14800 [Candidatus Methylumidiphilus sp.]
MHNPKKPSQRQPAGHRIGIFPAILMLASPPCWCDTPDVQGLYTAEQLLGVVSGVASGVIQEPPLQGDGDDMDWPAKDNPEDNLGGDPGEGFFARPPDENEHDEEMYGDEDMHGTADGR